MKRDKLRWLTARPIAHRGLHDASNRRPENTLPAFAAAIERRYAIECDLHLSADGVPMVFHDNDLQRLTGRPGCVRDLTADALRALRVAGTQAWIPTLDETLGLVAGRVPLLIELKHMPSRDAGFAWAVVQQLKRYDGPAALMSFDAGLIQEVRAAAPFIPFGLTAEGNLLAAYRNLRTALRLDVDFMSYSIDDLPTLAPLIARRVFGIPLISWTVRNEAQLRKARSLSDQITFEGFHP